MAKSVLIVGASGVVGYAALQHFSTLPDCKVTVLSRRAPLDMHGARFLAADLLDEARCLALRDEMGPITHVVYTALHERPQLIAGWLEQEQMRNNDLMLRNLFKAIEASSAALEHVCLLQGTKAYGVHVRSIPAPAREDRDEAYDQPNFYWLQQDLLKQRQQGQGWHWTILRPQIIIGESIGSPMNLIPAIGTYAALLKQAGSPLHFPGREPNLTEATDAGLLARAIAWAGDSPSARNQAFNVTNGDVLQWHGVWPAIADAFGMEAGETRPQSLAAAMPLRADEWDEIRNRHGLLSPGLDAFVGLSFQYADSCLAYADERRAAPALLSTIKLRQAGFADCIDTEAMFRHWIGVFQDNRLLPPRDG